MGCQPECDSGYIMPILRDFQHKIVGLLRCPGRLPTIALQEGFCDVGGDAFIAVKEQVMGREGVQQGSGFLQQGGIGFYPEGSLRRSSGRRPDQVSISRDRFLTAHGLNRQIIDFTGG